MNSKQKMCILVYCILFIFLLAIYYAIQIENHYQSVVKPSLVQKTQTTQPEKSETKAWPMEPPKVEVMSKWNIFPDENYHLRYIKIEGRLAVELENFISSSISISFLPENQKEESSGHR